MAAPSCTCRSGQSAEGYGAAQYPRRCRRPAFLRPESWECTDDPDHVTMLGPGPKGAL